MTKLPDNFMREMKELLGETEFQLFLDSFNRKSRNGLRVNELKVSADNFEKMSSLRLEKIPWVSNGYFCPEEGRVSAHPYYYAGLYYLQEPSAMTPASLLPVRPGDIVLDLCAAPGGKATELAARLRGKGILAANDISPSRAQALLKNLEKTGAANIAVLSEDPEKLKNVFPETFDAILVDAPCSGEGMFRREPSMIRFWQEHGPDHYSLIQRRLILQAAAMLKPGGYLMYSTCTFSPLENEGTVSHLLKQDPSFSVHKVRRYGSFSHGLPPFEDAVRIFPHKADGDGHFAVLLRKKPYASVSENSHFAEGTALPGRHFEPPREAADFLNSLKAPAFLREKGHYFMKEDQLYYVPEHALFGKKLRFLRTGLFLGRCRKKRFEPSQALAMALKKEEFPLVLDLTVQDDRVLRYLKGETIFSDLSGKGWILICCDGFSLGFGKLQDGIIKNKYAPGWRMLQS